MIAGLVCGAQLNGRINERNSVLTRSEPFAYAAQNLYAALSAADAAAGSAFLSGGIETGPMRAQYQQALARASSALADALYRRLLSRGGRVECNAEVTREHTVRSIAAR